MEFINKGVGVSGCLELFFLFLKVKGLIKNEKALELEVGFFCYHDQ